MSFTTYIRKLLSEMPMAQASPKSKSVFHADYYAVTPKGTKGRFQRTSTLWHMQGAASETAVLAYLRTLHPGCDIQIQNVSFD